MRRKVLKKVVCRRVIYSCITFAEIQIPITGPQCNIYIDTKIFDDIHLREQNQLQK